MLIIASITTKNLIKQEKMCFFELNPVLRSRKHPVASQLTPKKAESDKAQARKSAIKLPTFKDYIDLRLNLMRHSFSKQT